MGVVVVTAACGVSIYKISTIVDSSRSPPAGLAGVSIYKISTIVDEGEVFCTAGEGVSIYKISTIVDVELGRVTTSPVLVYTRFLLLPRFLLLRLRSFQPESSTIVILSDCLLLVLIVLFVPNVILCASPLLFCWCLFYDRSFLRPKEEEMTYKC